jgi:hypothetical protein
MSINKHQKAYDAWGLKRISQREKLDLNDTSYSYPASQGAGINAYVIDTVFKHLNNRGSWFHTLNFKEGLVTAYRLRMMATRVNYKN